MNSAAPAPAAPGTGSGDPHGLIGLPTIMTMAFRGIDLTPLGQQLIARAEADPADANALMDLSVVLQLKESRELGLAVQAQALQLQQLYRLPAKGGTSAGGGAPASGGTSPRGGTSARGSASASGGAQSKGGAPANGGAPAVRLLAIMAPGDLMANTPLEFLLQESDVALDMLYVLPDMPFPAQLPEHDLIFIAVCESDANRALLQQLAGLAQSWHCPVLNQPARIDRTGREAAHALLAPVAGVDIPPSSRIDRSGLKRLRSGELAPAGVLQDGRYPIIIRPVDAHAGHGLEKIDAPQALDAYLQAQPESEFVISQFVDYCGADGLYRKYRVALIDGRPYAVHMGLSAHWMIHYLNAGMTESAEKRAEEARFFSGFDAGFARRHGAALSAIAARLELDYAVIDCAESRHGKLLLFELDTGAVVHSMDPDDLFPYKRPQMDKVYAAFRGLLSRDLARGARPGDKAPG